ncbi:hypothetical protein MIZ01_1742 [Sideroxyarcus emersonii]|uniref:Uncharacterized protein n=1 Tax=Sideroxyarcus emersonii TaxID=2764705 RepID=A0AAN1XAQ8_9PROT|nr:hypothetical protein MIZ01_1742 [Sideroxyarcus emersonii]
MAPTEESGKLCLNPEAGLSRRPCNSHADTWIMKSFLDRKL